MTTNRIGLAICLLLSARIVFAQWEPTNGPFGGEVTCFAVAGSRVIAGTDRGVFVSTDNGLSWKAANTGLPGILKNNGSPSQRLTALFARDSSIYLAYNGTVYLSVDGGKSWTPRGNGLPADIMITSFAFSGNDLFAASESGLFRSADGATDWEAVTGPDGVFGVNAIATSRSIVLGLDNLSIYRSTDDGTSWMALPAVLPHGADALAALDTDFFVGTDFGPYRSTDSGSTWIAVNSGIDNSNFSAFAVADSTLFAAGSWTSGVFRLAKDRNSWVHATDGFTNARVSALAMTGLTVFAGTLTEGVFRSTDGGTHWEKSTSGLRPLETRALAVSKSNLIGATEYGTFVSTDNGTTWILTSGPQNATRVAAEGSIVFATSQSFGDQMQVSTDRGESWNVVDLGWPYWASVLTMLPSGSNLYLASEPVGEWSGGLFGFAIDSLVRSSIHSALFHMETQLIGSPYLVYALAVWDTTIYVGASNGVFLATRDHKWVFVGLGGVHVNSLLVADSNLYAGTTSGFFHSSDHGSIWVKSVSGPGDSVVTTLFLYGADLFAGTSHTGVFHSSDRGVSWTDVSTGLPGLNVLSMTVLDSYLFAGTEDGAVSRRPLSELIDVIVTASPPHLIFPPNRASFSGGEFQFLWTPVAGAMLYHLQSSKDSLFQSEVFLDDSTLTDTMRSDQPTDTTFKGYLEGRSYWRVRARTIAGWSAWSTPWSYVFSPTAVNEPQLEPLQFALEQNYPNPFNPLTTIKYSLGGAGGRGSGVSVKLTVYDVLGREVAVLVNERKPPGSYQVRFDGSGLASGVYFYRLKAGDFIQTKKLIVLQ